MLGYRAHPMVRRRLLTVVLLVAGVALAPSAASANPVDQRQRQVNAILARIEQLGDQANRLNEQRNGTLVQLERAKAELTAAQAQLAALSTQTEDLRDEVRRFLITSYVTGGDQNAITGLFDPAAATVAGVRAVYTQALSGARSDAIENYQAATAAQARQRSEQATLTNRIADATTRLEQTKSSIEQVLLAQRTELDKAKGDLAAAVVAEQRRRAEEEARRSREAAAAAAARLAAQQAAAEAARRQPLTVSAPAQPGAAPGTGAAPGRPGVSPPGPTTTLPPVPPTSPRAAIAVRAALSQLGVPYVFATRSPGVSFDCSGLTKWAWSQAGVEMSHFTGSQIDEFPAVPLSQILPGDLVFPGEGHVGLYIGNGQMVHAPRTGDVVKISPVGELWAAVRPG